jgi:hypothetical protein
MKILIAVFVILCMPLALFGQAPRPYLLGGADLMPSGYASLAVQGGGGIEWETRYSVFDSYAGYDNGRKANDNTLNNYKGHDRLLRGFLGYKQGPWYAGVGARWSQLSTTNYTKGGDPFSAGSWHPEAGFGRDWNARTAPLFLRTQILYMFREQREVTDYPGQPPCVGCGSGSQGADISLWFPSPEHKGHWFYKMNVVLFAFHDSFTDPTNVALTNEQAANKHLGDVTEFSLGYRF